MVNGFLVLGAIMLFPTPAKWMRWFIKVAQRGLEMQEANVAFLFMTCSKALPSFLCLPGTSFTSG